MWTPPLFQHLGSDEADCSEDGSSTAVTTTHSGRVVQPPEHYGH